jgi:glycosyltransferase involved in cell wall biosynthesis
MTRMSVALLTLGDPDRVTGGYLYHRRLAKRAAAHGADLRFVSVPALPFPLAIATGPRWLAQLRAVRTDVVVLDSIAASAAASWLRWVDPPLVAMLHQLPGGMDRPRVARWLAAPFDRWAYRPARLLIAASDWLADELRRRGVSPRRLVVIPPGRDAENGAAGGDRSPPAGDDADFRRGRSAAALCVANWLPRKGVVELLDALARVEPGLITLHLVGDRDADGRYAARVRHLIRSPALADRVVVHGVIDPATVARMYARADLFALPSFEEPYGTVWGEAMAAGLPVVGWRAGNLPYLADHPGEAIMVAPADVPALADWLARLASDPALRASIGVAAARRALQRPTWDESAARFFDTLRGVVG